MKGNIGLTPTTTTRPIKYDWLFSEQPPGVRSYTCVIKEDIFQIHEFITGCEQLTYFVSRNKKIIRIKTDADINELKDYCENYSSVSKKSQ